MGLEAEGISPPGTGPGGEFGGGMPDVRRFIQEVFGIHNPGAAISAFAQLHLETHEACDEAVGLG